MAVVTLRKAPTGRFVETGEEPFPAPGGGLLRVPVGGGDPEELPGTIAGQLIYWQESGGLWLPTATGPSDGQLAQWNAAAQTWEFVEAGTGAINYFALDSDTAGLWNFDDTLADTSGNGNDLELEAGAYGFADVVPGIKGLRYAIGARLAVPGFSAALALTGAMTVELIVARDTTPEASNESIFVAHGSNGTDSDPANNTLYQLSVPSGTNPPVALTSFWEQGAGVNIGFTTSTANGADSLGNIHGVEYIAQTRSASGVVQNWVNGRSFGAPSSPLTLPTGGGNGRFFVAAPMGATSPVRNVILGIRVGNVERTAAAIVASYNHTLGGAFGKVSL